MNFTMSSLSLRRYQSDDSMKGDLESKFHNSPRPNRVKTALFCVFILFLCTGWIVAFDLARSPRLVNYPGLSSSHPFPPEIFTRVKKVFEPDEQYIGPSNRTHHNWDRLVAGNVLGAGDRRVILSSPDSRPRCIVH
jgi:hypothetical protein